jgi:prephenate dehydrogenase
MSLKFRRIGIIGIGSIGSSFALAIRKKNLTDEIWGYSNTGSSSKRAKELGIIDYVANNLFEIGKNCDFIFIAIPVLSIPLILKELAQYAREDTIITDGGSTKHFVEECHKYFKFKNFIGGHPIAGTEKSGPESGFAELYENNCCILTPVRETDIKKLEIVKAVWETIGMNVVIMSPKEHDKIMANISHMPHVIAYCLVDSVKDKYFNGDKITKLAGGGFKDFTRIAKSDESMWTDIFLANQKYILSAIDDFEKSLKELKTFVIEKDFEKIKNFLARAKKSLLD